MRACVSGWFFCSAMPPEVIEEVIDASPHPPDPPTPRPPTPDKDVLDAML